MEVEHREAQRHPEVEEVEQRHAATDLNTAPTALPLRRLDVKRFNPNGVGSVSVSVHDHQWDGYRAGPSVYLQIQGNQSVFCKYLQ